jgi:O-antigen/teichoic acid export membrane protein
LHMWVMPNRAVLSANLVVKPQTLARLCEGALNLGLSLLLGKLWGLFGVLVATAISGLLSSMWLLPWLTARMFHRPFLQFIRDDAAPMLLLFTLLIPVALLGRYLATSLMGFGGALAGFVFTGGAGVALLWWVIFDESLRARFPWRKLYEQKVLAPVRAWTGGL